jgi:hypothetical protein
LEKFLSLAELAEKNDGDEKMIKYVTINKPMEITQFEIQKPIRSLWVSAKLNQKLKLLLFIRNPQNVFCGFISLYDSNFINEIYISDTACTMNGLNKELETGTYTLISISPFYEMGTSAELCLEIETNVSKTYDDKYIQDNPDSSKRPFEQIVDETHRYYKGDFHGHTIYSDGHQSITEAAEVLRKQKMDFMAFTEHNSMPFGCKELPCLIIPSFELTLPIGHVNIHGIRDFSKLIPELQTANTIEMLLDRSIDCFRQECNISINHMFMEPWDFTYGELDLSKVNTIEVICDPTYDSAATTNNMAVAFLDYMWQEGLTLYGIGGSDSHNKVDELYEGSCEPSIYGDPATYVYCGGLSVNNIIEGIKKGHCYVSRYGAIEIDICDDKYLPGDQIPECEEFITYHIKLNYNCKSCTGRFIMDGKIIKEVTMNDKNSEIFYTFKNEEKPWWFRFGLYDLQGDVVAYVNPIYNKRETSKPITLQELLDHYSLIHE